ncbi:hypothetical protein [Oceanobacter sp. 3_MG-2023]|uniref:hypothetical protein n=1 Tax=Oceanobacter sp. 3_MG-2023 TaxID=3062622 RepID=UPI0027372A05|nr:hypothetical protein [Oceanobacter sp. 3_MG-2023]MDP2506723.1 hypothetical protein [Oceanobacter sp. 3_MG-2023]
MNRWHSNVCYLAGLILVLSVLPVAAHEGHGDELPWEACQALEKSAQCAYTNSHGDVYRGTCRVFSGGLMCVRNQPIIHGEVQQTDSHKDYDALHQGASESGTSEGL